MKEPGRLWVDIDRQIVPQVMGISSRYLILVGWMVCCLMNSMLYEDNIGHLTVHSISLCRLD